MYIDRQIYLKDEFSRAVNDVLISYMFKTLDETTKYRIQRCIVEKLHTFMYDYELKLLVDFRLNMIDITLFARGKWDPNLYIELKSSIDNSFCLYKACNDSFEEIVETAEVPEVLKIVKEIDYLAIAIEVCGGTSN